VRLYVHIQLDAGGKVTIQGEDLSADDIHEVFRALAGKQVESVPDKTKTETT